MTLLGTDSLEMQVQIREISGERIELNILSQFAKPSKTSQQLPNN